MRATGILFGRLVIGLGDWKLTLAIGNWAEQWEIGIGEWKLVLGVVNWCSRLEIALGNWKLVLSIGNVWRNIKQMKYS